MSDEQLLEIMAHADGELASARQPAVEQLLASNPTAAALHKELVATRELLRAHEPVATVPDSRGFYWSQIQRRIAAEERAAERAAPAKASALPWLRWLAPAAGLAAVALVVVLQQGSGPAVVASNGPGLAAGSEANGMTFTSEADGVTISWIN